MRLTAVVEKAELAALVESLAPLRVTIDERRGRYIALGRPALELVRGRGLRLRGDARVAWDVAGFAIPVAIHSWQLLLVPKVASQGGSHRLVFAPVLEELDLKLVPSVIDDKIADAVKGAIAQHGDKLAWTFSRTLSRRLALSARIAPSKMFEILAVEGAVFVGDDELRLTVRFEARIENAPARPVEAPPRVTPGRAPRRPSRHGLV